MKKHSFCWSFWTRCYWFHGDLEHYLRVLMKLIRWFSGWWLWCGILMNLKMIFWRVRISAYSCTVFGDFQSDDSFEQAPTGGGSALADVTVLRARGRIKLVIPVQWGQKTCAEELTSMCHTVWFRALGLFAGSTLVYVKGCGHASHVWPGYSWLNVFTWPLWISGGVKFSETTIIKAEIPDLAWIIILYLTNSI